MKSMVSMTKVVGVILCVSLLAIILGGHVGLALGDEPPEPVASSISARSTDPGAELPEERHIPDSEFDLFLYLPVAFRPALLSAFAQEVVELTNQERVRAGCAPLTVNLQLVQAAQGHSEDMALNDFFSHTGSDGSAPWDRIEAAGYQWREAGENIAAGYSTPQDVMDGWMDSEGHRANILRCSYQEIGVGYVFLEQDPGSINYRHYWTQVFARPR